jgi:hypothetical protein
VTELNVSDFIRQAEYSIDLASVEPALEVGVDSDRTRSPERIAITIFLVLFIVIKQYA